MVKSIPVAAKVGAAILLVFLVSYMLVPILVVAGASLSESRFLSFPPNGFSLEWYGVALTSDIYLVPLQASLFIAVIAAAVASLFGTAAALAVTRFPLPFSGAIQSFLLSPLIVPSIILGIGTLTLVSIVGQGPDLWVLIVVHAVLGVPYVMRTVTGVMARSDRFTEEAARTLGAGAWQRYRFVVFPLARPGIVAGAFFAFNISFDDAVIALFLRTPQLETLPIAIYGRLEFSTDPSVAAISTLMVLITVVTMIALEKAIGLGKAFV